MILASPLSTVFSLRLPIRGMPPQPSTGHKRLSGGARHSPALLVAALPRAELVRILLTNRVESRFRYHHRIEQSNSQEVTGPAEALGDLSILSARTWIPARVVVSDDDRHGTNAHCGLKHLPRMNQGSGCSSDAHHLIRNRSVSAIEHKHYKMLAGIASHHPSNEPRNIGCASNVLLDPPPRAPISHHSLPNHDGGGHDCTPESQRLRWHSMGLTWQRQNTAELPIRRLSVRSPVFGSVSLRL